METTTPQISVIIPVYNIEKHLQRCINSILTQTFTDFEILLIDDGSTDKSGNICDEYANKDNRIKVFHKENGGVSSARNVGLRNALGHWIAFVDSDDFVDPNWLQSFDPYDETYMLKMQGYTALNKNIQFKCTLSKEKIIGKKNILNKLIELEKKQNTVFRVPWSKLYKNKIIKENNINFNESISLGEDYLFSLYYLLQISSLYITDDIKYNYCIENSTLNKKKYSFSHNIYTYNEFNIVANKFLERTKYTTFYSYIISQQLEALLHRVFRLNDCSYEEKKTVIDIYKHVQNDEINMNLSFPYNSIVYLRKLKTSFITKIISLFFKIISLIK